MSTLFRGSLTLCGRRLILEPLEERIVLDASVSDVNQDQDTDQAPETAQDAGSGAGAQPADSGTQAQAAEPSLDQVYGVDLSVVLISNALDEVEALAAAVGDSATAVIYDAANTDLAGINEILSEIVASNDGQEISHLAILCHANPGVLRLSPKFSLGQPLQLVSC
ncbi:DUF4347 domain-containing protein [Thermodesulfobacteriota bacterium]